VDILDDMGVSKLSAKVSSKVNYSFKATRLLHFFKLKQQYFFTENSQVANFEPGPIPNQFFFGGNEVSNS